MKFFCERFFFCLTVCWDKCWGEFSKFFGFDYIQVPFYLEFYNCESFFKSTRIFSDSASKLFDWWKCEHFLTQSHSRSFHKVSNFTNWPKFARMSFDLIVNQTCNQNSVKLIIILHSLLKNMFEQVHVEKWMRHIFTHTVPSNPKAAHQSCSHFAATFSKW